MTPASREPVSWRAVTRDLNRYRVMSAMAMLRQLTQPLVSELLKITGSKYFSV
jgi:hypothetical protein